MTETALDRAHARMLAAGESEPARRGFFAALAAAELVVVLEAEVEDNAATIRPLTLETEQGRLILAFDTEARMADFLGRGAPTATMPGRQLARMLAPAGLGIALNPEVAPSAILLPAEAMVWLAEVAPAAAELRQARIAGIAPPRTADPALLDALDARLAMLSGLSPRAALAEAAHADGSTALVLGLWDVPEAGQSAASAALAEALSLSGLPGTALDVVFVDSDSDFAARLLRQGLVYDIPAPAATVGTPAPPGSDPARPPKLR